VARVLMPTGVALNVKEIGNRKDRKTKSAYNKVVAGLKAKKKRKTRPSRSKKNQTLHTKDGIGLGRGKKKNVDFEKWGSNLSKCQNSSCTFQSCLGSQTLHTHSMLGGYTGSVALTG